MRRLSAGLIGAILLGACGSPPAPPGESDSGTVEVTLEAELPAPGEGPIGGVEFVVDFASDEIINVAPNELVLSTDEPVQIALPAADWTAVAMAWTMSDVVNADGGRNRLGQAGAECSHEFALAPGERIELRVVFRLGGACLIED